MFDMVTVATDAKSALRLLQWLPAIKPGAGLLRAQARELFGMAAAMLDEARAMYDLG